MVVGVSGTLLDLTILTVLKQFFDAPTLTANLFSYSMGILNNYILNRLWTYSDSRSKSAAVQFWQFVLVSLIGLALNSLVLALVEEPFARLISSPRFGYLPAKVAATGVGLAWNYLANRLWTFNDAR